MNQTRIYPEVQRAVLNKDDHVVYLDLIIDPLLPDKSFKSVAQKLLAKKSLGESLRNQGLMLSPGSAPLPAQDSGERERLRYGISQLLESRAPAGAVELARIETIQKGRESYMRVAVDFRLRDEKESIHQNAVFLSYAIR
jgi:hypothetical protein